MFFTHHKKYVTKWEPR